MIIVPVEGKDNLEKALKKWKRKFENLKISKELRKRKEYSKPSEIRREVIKKAVGRENWIKNSES